MVLVIQELSEQLTEVRDQIKDERDKISKDFLNKEKLKELFAECDQYKEKLESETKLYKKKKFERDAMDYHKGRVYPWRNRPQGSKQKGRHHSNHFQQESGPLTMETDSDTNYSTASTASSSFLEDGPRKRGRPRGQRGQTRGNRGGRGNAGGGNQREQDDMTRFVTRTRRR